MTLQKRSWVPTGCESLVMRVAGETGATASSDVLARIEALAADNKRIHEAECFNLNPATNVMNPRAEALLFATAVGHHNIVDADGHGIGMGEAGP